MAHMIPGGLEFDRTLDGSDVKRFINFNAFEIPEVAHWKVGEEYALRLVVKQTARHEEGGQAIVGEFEIMKAEAEYGNDERTLDLS